MQQCNVDKMCAKTKNRTINLEEKEYNLALWLFLTVSFGVEVSLGP